MITLYIIRNDALTLGTAPYYMNKVNDYCFASFRKDPLRKHFEKLIADESLRNAISNYIFFAQERYSIVDCKQAPITFHLMKMAEKYARQLIYMDKHTIDEFKKVCTALSIIQLGNIAELSDTDEFMDMR